MHTRLRTEREKRKWSQRFLAELVGVNNATVSLWESLQTKPRRRPAEKLERLFGLSLYELLQNDDGAARMHSDDPIHTNPAASAKTPEVRHGS